MSSQHLSQKELEHIAKLANINLTPDENDKYRSQLEDTLKYIENLNEINTEKTIPTIHPNPQENVYFLDGTGNERLLDKEMVLKNAKKSKNNYFIVDRIQ